MSQATNRPDEPQAVVGIRDLRNQVAAVVRRAGAGERLVVTVDGRPVAQLGPLQPDRTGVTLWDLAAAGLIEPPRRPVAGPGARTEQPSPPIPLPADLTADRLLESSRGR
ncbi:MAG: type II toxin-antitoxin system prevent-host-death family antitoxin [Actinomycetota bacterium]